MNHAAAPLLVLFSARPARRATGTPAGSRWVLAFRGVALMDTLPLVWQMVLTPASWQVGRALAAEPKLPPPLPNPPTPVLICLELSFCLPF